MYNAFKGIEGYLPENLRSDLTWNRVANVSGRPGANVGLDLVNEFLNNDFKGGYISLLFWQVYCRSTMLRDKG